VITPAFLDTNVLIYAMASADPRCAAARDLLRRRCLVSVQVLNEFAAVAHRLGHPWDQITQALAAIRTLCQPPLPLTLGVHERALGIAARTGYRFYDAMILASALEAGCHSVFSEDMQHGQRIDGTLTIINPFPR
jgi:predicted nucleic acid-binding protein